MSNPAPSPAPKPPLLLITDTDKKGLIVVVAAVTLSFLLVCFFVRVYVRLRVIGPWSHDDSILSVATAVGVLQSVAVFLQVDSGFGESKEFLSDHSIARIGKITYATDLLYLITLYLSKCSVVALIMRITPKRRHLLVSWGTIAASTIWAVSSILLITIRCSPAEPLTNLPAQCSSLFARWQYVCALDIVTDVACFAIAVYLVSGLQMPTQTKALVVLAFSLRLPVIAAAAARLHYLHRKIYSPEPTLAGALAAVWTQVEVNYSLIATCAACLGPFIRPFSKPYLADARYATPGSIQRSANGGYNLSDMSSDGYLKRDQSTKLEQTLASKPSTGNLTNQPQQRSRPDPAPQDVRSNNRPSLDSHDSKRMIITKGVEWTVEYDGAIESAGRGVSRETNQT